MTEHEHRASGAIETPAQSVWRVLTTPIGAPLPWARSAGRRVRDAVGGADLPDPVRDLIRRVSRGTRLWAREQEDVARELVSHFRGAAAEGASPEAAIRDFGEARTAARLIRRAKKRARPLIWHAWVRAWQAVGAAVLLLLGVYGFLALRLALAEPSITHDYVADLNAAALRLPEADRAWPLYEQAEAALIPLPEHLRKHWGWIEPESPLWNDAADYVRGNRGAIELIRRGALKPALGLVLGEARASSARAGPGAGPPRSAGEPRSVEEAIGGAFDATGWLAYLLLQDSRLAEIERRADGVEHDLAALIGMADQLRGGPTLLSQSLSVTLYGWAVQRLRDVLWRNPGLLSDAQLTALCHRLAAHGGGGPVRLDFGADRPSFLDMVQRLYTDDGRGDGRLTGRGVERLRSGTWPWHDNLLPHADLARPLFPSLAFSRRRIVEEYDRLIGLAREEAATPPLLRQGSLDKRFLARTGAGEGGGLLRQTRYSPLECHFEVLGSLIAGVERVTARRDGVLVVAALELHRRSHGSYPDTLDRLAPALLPAVPTEPFSGRPYRYRLLDGRPVLSCGDWDLWSR